MIIIMIMVIVIIMIPIIILSVTILIYDLDNHYYYHYVLRITSIFRTRAHSTCFQHNLLSGLLFHNTIPRYGLFVFLPPF